MTPDYGFGFGGQSGFGFGASLGGARNPAAFARAPAPTGFRWEFVTFQGQIVTYKGEPDVALVGA